MTSSNQKFIITGDKDKLLKEVLKLIDFLEDRPLNDKYKPVKGLIITDEALEFVWCVDPDRYSELYKQDISKLVPINCIDTFPMIKNWLDSNDYKKAVEPSYPGDGGNKKGWQIELGKEGGGYEFYIVFKIRPFYTYYSK